MGFAYRSELTIAGDIHLRARNYDPLTGRFPSLDPLDGVNGRTMVSNPYAHAENDPIGMIDPHGLRPTDAGISAPPGNLLNELVARTTLEFSDGQIRSLSEFQPMLDRYANDPVLTRNFIAGMMCQGGSGARVPQCMAYAVNVLDFRQAFLSHPDLRAAVEVSEALSSYLEVEAGGPSIYAELAIMGVCMSPYRIACVAGGLGILTIDMIMNLRNANTPAGFAHAQFRRGTFIDISMIWALTVPGLATYASASVKGVSLYAESAGVIVALDMPLTVAKTTMIPSLHQAQSGE